MMIGYPNESVDDYDSEYDDDDGDDSDRRDDEDDDDYDGIFFDDICDD